MGVSVPRAYVFINANDSDANDLLEDLRKTPGVKEAHRLYGVYDLVAELETETFDALKETVYLKIRKHDKIKSTVTSLVME